ncbi:MAG: isoprenyl transferase [Propionibacteriaceae bacterium]|nr:isoprenyl transferase [Propionibacteriaceae bacterium]
MSPIRPPRVLYTAYERRLRRTLTPSTLPRHVAVLADGNRRWARANAPDEPLFAGYRAGANKLREFCAWCDDLGIPLVTLWVLSTDNLGRDSDDELGPLLDIIADLVDDLATRHRVRAVGALDLLPAGIADRLRSAEVASKGRHGLHVNVAVAYGGRQELRDAVRSLLAEQAAEGVTLSQLASTLEVDQIEAHLYTSGQPDPDLIIRTSGEQRLSGFLMWQSAHSEFYFCEALWPDFRRVDFYRALRSYAQRERRFGL